MTVADILLDLKSRHLALTRQSAALSRAIASLRREMHTGLWFWD